MANPERIHNILKLLKPRIVAGEKLTLVFSAFSGVTDQLIEVAMQASRGKSSYTKLLNELKTRHLEALSALVSPDHPVNNSIKANFEVLSNLLKGVILLREASPRTMDYILSFGERNSCEIIAAHFFEHSVHATYLDARNIIKTNKNFGEAQVVFSQTDKLISTYYREHSDQVHIVTGFIGSDIGGLTTTLGRGGSDYTAAILAGALDAEVLEIWTDVDGVLTSNPRVVKNAYSIPELSFDEAMELSHFGAKVIYPPTIQPALAKNIPIYILNTFNPTHPGTRISSHTSLEGKRKITGVTSLSEISLLTVEGSGMIGIPGSAARVFGALAKAKVNIIMISQASSEHSICVAVKKNHQKIAIDAISEEFEKEISSSQIKQVRSESDLSLIAVIGERMKAVPGVAGSLFKSLGNNGINVIAIAQGSSELNITFAINSKDESKALNLVHDAFFLSENKRINIFLVGLGLIGSALIEQIKQQKKYLASHHNIDLRVVGLANSKRMFFDANGVNLEDWQSSLLQSEEKSSLAGFVQQMSSMNLANSIFVDCTANPSIKDYYLTILDNSISISTANKVAASSDLRFYHALHQTALKRNAGFYYETNVGAGLPVLGTITNLVKSGDYVTNIQAVISGSLSYIFNNYSPDKDFKSLILEARSKGYTEPDPREDLSGNDIKRKIIILSRVAGYHIEPQDVHVEALLPESCMIAPTIEAFFDELEKHDTHFRNLIEDVHRSQLKLRYIASLDDGKATIRLARVGADSPFYNLASTDNMVVIKTLRYSERPMVIAGPGAGADVTAGGVFAEIIQYANARE